MAIAGYKLRINGGALVDSIVNVGLVYSYLFTGLDPETEYGVEVSSYDEEGVMSAWSSVVYATTDSAPTLTVVMDEEGNVLVDEEGNVITVII